ncbi:MAG: SH3 domain of the SH3b1 type [Candidatus Omnitrophica bacterium ADurb.Bin277]|nr:MAG: SH3 domain of the SH3b1 type [Candidatus Omnitrophica bacterium ADurb.Bin277]
MLRTLFLIIPFLFAATHAMAEELPPLPNGPLILTSATPAMQSSEFWIRRLPDPDAVIKTPEQIANFNEFVRNLVKENVDIFRLDLTRPGRQITSQLELEFNTLRNRKLFGTDDKYIQKNFFDETIKPLVQIDKVPGTIRMRWGAAVRATSVRALPTMVKMLEDRGDVEFDQLQFTLIKLWTPVGIFHQSSDGQWFYVQAPYVRGWVRARDIAVFPSRPELKKYASSGRYLVVTGEGVNVWKDSQMTTLLQRPSMGTVIPRAPVPSQGGLSSDSGSYLVWIPYRKKDGTAGVAKAYISRKSDVRTSFLPYTQANVIRQAFKLLGRRYGWGGQYNGRDCSGFVQDVFLGFGFAFPRDSKQQGWIGIQLGFFEPFEDAAAKAKILNSARPALTLLRMPKHQMIYLGRIEQQYYVIHSTWAERTGYDPKKDEKNRINQVVVSDLNLNGDSYIGSLFDRIISMNEVE